MQHTRAGETVQGDTRTRAPRVLAVSLSAALCAASAVSAAVIELGDGCSLVSAIEAANRDEARGGCAAGSGADEIVLTADVVLDEVYNDFGGPTATPKVQSEIRVAGNGFAIERDPTAPPFRIFYVLEKGARLELNDLTIRNGLADGPVTGGGALVNHRGTVVLNRCSLLQSSSLLGSGGAVWTTDSSTWLIETEIAGASTPVVGGAVAVTGRSTLVVVNSTLHGNEATFDGGGVYVDIFSRPLIVNSTISGNTAGGHGGGIYTFASDFVETTQSRLVHSIVTGNAGEGVYTWRGSRTYLFDSIVVDNDTDCAGGGELIDLGGNFAGDLSCGEAAEIVPGVDYETVLADNGGMTPTHALLPGSAAADVRPNCRVRFDQRRFPRDALCDAGPFEFSAEDRLRGVGGSDQ